MVFEPLKRAGTFLSPFAAAPFFDTHLEASDWAAAYCLLDPLSLGHFETIEIRKVSRHLYKTRRRVNGRRHRSRLHSPATA